MFSDLNKIKVHFRRKPNSDGSGLRNNVQKNI
jgi:hypothetical protein